VAIPPEVATAFDVVPADEDALDALRAGTAGG
jgi:hypothetical protein